MELAEAAGRELASKPFGQIARLYQVSGVHVSIAVQTTVVFGGGLMLLLLLELA